MLSSSSSSSKIAPSPAIGMIPEQQQQQVEQPQNPRRSLLRKSNRIKNSSIEIEVQWKETTNRRVRFDPDMDWKTETSKAEQGHLRRLAEKEIRKRLDAHKQLQKGKPLEWRQHPQLQAEFLLSRSDRQKEVFLYICFCEVDLLMDQYSNDNFVLARMFDRLFEEAGIKPPRTHCSVGDSQVEESTESPWLWTCFLALQLEYRRAYENKTEIQIPSRFFPHPPFASGLGRNSDQALFFIHWLSPAFRYDEKESKQRQVFDSILGDSKAMAKFEDYLFGESNENMNHLRLQVHGFFESILHSSLVTSDESSRRTDLRTFFLAIAEADAGSYTTECCEWSYEEYPNGRKSMFPYHQLTCESKDRLFLISAMPAYCAYLQKTCRRQEKEEPNVASERGQCLESNQCCPELLRFGCSSTHEQSNTVSAEESTVLEEQDPKSLVVTDISTDAQCALLSPNYEYEIRKEIFNLLFEGA